MWSHNAHMGFPPYQRPAQGGQLASDLLLVFAIGASLGGGLEVGSAVVSGLFHVLGIA